MLWSEIVTCKSSSNSEWKTACSRVLGIPLDEVQVVGDESSIGDASVVTIVLRSLEGDFRQHASLYVLETFHRLPSDEEFGSKICKQLDTSALVSDSSENPFSMILIQPDGSAANIFVDPDALDRNEYRISNQ